MSLTAWVDVAIGLALVYLGASLFVTVINEYIGQIVNLRGRKLLESLGKLVPEGALKSELGKIRALEPFFGGQSQKATSYIDPTVLAWSLVGIVKKEAGTNPTGIPKLVDALDPALATQLAAVAGAAADKMEQLTATVGDWIDRSLKMLGEGYRRTLQLISFGIGFVLAGLFNLDTVALTGHLYRDKEAREAAVAIAVQVAEGTDKQAFDTCLAMAPKQRKEEPACAPFLGLIDAVQGQNAWLGQLPIGWPAPNGVWPWITRVVGWLLTALAVSLGAPFWFDLLNKFVNVRHGMRKPQPKQDLAQPARS